MTEPALAFRTESVEGGACTVRVNFGLYAGRNATQAEIEDLARALNRIVESFAIVAEERHEFGGSIEAAVRQTVIEIQDEGHLDDELCDRIVARAEAWAAECIRSRSELGELGES